MVQCVHAFGRRRSKHVRQVLAQELMDVRTRGVVALNVNHAHKSSGPAKHPAFPNETTQSKQADPALFVLIGLFRHQPCQKRGLPETRFRSYRGCADFLAFLGGGHQIFCGFQLQPLSPHGAEQHEHNTEDAERPQDVAGERYTNCGRPDRLGSE